MKLKIEKHTDQKSNRSRSQSIGFGREEKMAASNPVSQSYSEQLYISMTPYLCQGKAGKGHEENSDHVTTNSSLREQIAIENANNNQRIYENPQHIFERSTSVNDPVNPVPQSQFTSNAYIANVSANTNGLFHHEGNAKQIQKQQAVRVYSIPADYPHFDEFQETTSAKDRTIKESPAENTNEDNHKRKICCVMF